MCLFMCSSGLQRRVHTYKFQEQETNDASQLALSQKIKKKAKGSRMYILRFLIYHCFYILTLRVSINSFLLINRATHYIIWSLG